VDEDDLDPQVPHSPPDGKRARSSLTRMRWRVSTRRLGAGHEQ
jgi:hypothetical protein